MKKDNLVLTISIGEFHENISKYSLPSIQEYAEKIGADFLNITDADSTYITQKWMKFNIYELLNKYKRIAGSDHNLAIYKNGNGYSFGRGLYGRLGHNNTDDQAVLKVISKLT